MKHLLGTLNCTPELHWVCTNVLSGLSLCVSTLQGSSKDIGQLAAALHHRILALKSRAEQEPEAPTTTIPEAEVPQSNEDDSDEEDNASASASASTPATSQWFLLLVRVSQHSSVYLNQMNVMIWSVCGFIIAVCSTAALCFVMYMFRQLAHKQGSYGGWTS